MKTKIILTLLLTVAISLISATFALAVDNCTPNGGICVPVTDPEKPPACPSGIQKTSQYGCQDNEAVFIGSICCIPPDAQKNEETCLGKKDGDPCIQTDCTPITPIRDSCDGVCVGGFCRPKSESNPSTASGNLPPELYIPTSEDTGLPSVPGGITQIIKNVLTWGLGIIGLLALISFVVSGIQYMLSIGKDTAMQKAERNMLYSIYGITIALSGVIIIKAIFYALSGTPFF